MINLSRKEKENLYKSKMTKLQRRWKDPVCDSDFDHILQWTDEQLDEGLKDTIGQLRFEIATSLIGKVIVGVFIIWCVVGFLTQARDTQDKTLLNGAIFLAIYFGLSWLYELRQVSHDTNKLLRDLISRK